MRATSTSGDTRASGTTALRKWHRQNVFLESGALRQTLEPALDVLQACALRHELAEAIGDQSDRNVAHREIVAGDERGLAELRIEDCQRLGRSQARLVDPGVIALFGR